MVFIVTICHIGNDLWQRRAVLKNIKHFNEVTTATTSSKLFSFVVLVLFYLFVYERNQCTFQKKK